VYNQSRGQRSIGVRNCEVTSARWFNSTLDLPQSVPMRVKLLIDAWLLWMSFGSWRTNSTRGRARPLTRRHSEC
jgi:hypothetical protein